MTLADAWGCPELQLRIIEFLSEPERDEAGNENSSDDKPEEELKLDDQVDSSEHLVPATLKHLLNLSATCSTFRRLLAPTVYKKIYLSNTVTSAASIKAVAEGPFNDLVTEVLFVGRAPGSEEEGFDNTEDVLPEPVKHILENLRTLFPRLNTLNIGFAYDLYDYEKWDDWTYESFLEEETDEQVLEEEKLYGFRALINDVWIAISSDTEINTRVTTLKMRHWIPKMSSVYASDPFRKFLSGIQRFSISIWGADAGAGWVSSVGLGYCDGLTRLSRLFDALTSCVEFDLEASQYGWYGLQGMNHAPHGFKAGQMPKLRRMSLRYCFVSPELRTFFVDHKGTLEEIVMKDCAASTNTYSGLAENGIGWSELFDGMIGAGMDRLERYEILPVLAPELLELVSIDGEESEKKEETEEDVRASEELARRNHGRRVFAYGYLDDKYGNFYDDDETDAERYEEGSDQRNWGALCELMESNKQRQRQKYQCGETTETEKRK